MRAKKREPMRDGLSEGERRRRVDEILLALEAAPEKRAALLEEASGGDAALRAELEALLSAAEGAASSSESQPHEPSEAPTMTLDQVPGERIGPYRTVGIIGAGGMGVVHEAHDTRLGRRVALKFLPPEYSRDPARKARFLREARAASSLDHPNICTIHDIGETEDGRLYMVMAYYEGETLKARLQRGPLAVEEAVDIAMQLSRGLRRAHEAGITHRDIKPANVMLTTEGRSMLLDFGVAKMSGEVDLTQEGGTLGTPAYMSPEQASGSPTDRRTDLWSLGVLLYEMLSGVRPFPADDPQAAIYAILREEPEALDQRRPEVPAALAQLVHRMLAKDPGDRPEDAGEVFAALGGGATQTVVAPAPPSRRRRRILAYAAAAVVALTAWWGISQRAAPPSDAALEDAGRKSLAVLFFENVSGDSELDWLRAGIADMLVTDLAQSTGLEVLSTSRLFQLLSDFSVEEGAPVPLAAVQRMAREESIEAVVRGRFLRDGSVLRITVQMEDALTGSLLQSMSVQGEGEGSLFAGVDELAETIRGHFEIARSEEMAESIQAVTTGSLEAWRYYTEALTLQNQARDREAIPLFEKALAIDPDFALALVELGRLHQNLGHGRLARELTQRAVDLSERLPVGIALQIQATHYQGRWATYMRAIDVYRLAIDRDPTELPFHNNLANLYFDLERYPEAIEEYQWLIERETGFGPTYSAAAWALAAVGDFERGEQILRARLEAHPDDWFGHAGLSLLYTQWGRLDQAEDALRPALELRGADSFVRWNRWRLAVLNEDWQLAETVTDEQLQSTDPWELWRGHVSAARHALYRGQSREALMSLRRAVEVYTDPDAQAALAHCWAAELLLELDEPAQALVEASLAIEKGKDDWPELQGVFLAARANQRLGDEARADEFLERLRSSWLDHPNVVEERQILHLEGLLAQARGDRRAAIERLTRAEALLPVEGVEYHFHTLPDQVPLWSALGAVEMAANRPSAAYEWFRRVAESGVEHVEFPLPYVRSFYHLGRIHDERGEPAEAREMMERFATYWRDGDLDRGRVGDALEATR